MSTSDVFQHASQHLLARNGISATVLDHILAGVGQHQVDFADIYCQHSAFESWQLEEGIVKSGSFNIDEGFGIRAIVGDKTAFAYADSILPDSLKQAAATVRAIARQGQSNAMRGAQVPTQVAVQYPMINPMLSLDATQKVALLEQVEALARAKDPRVVQVMATLACEHDIIYIARLDGRHAAAMVQHYVDKAVDQALVNLEARPAPAGAMKVVLGNGWPGVLLHEAVGHGLEGDFNRKETSAFSNKIGQQVAAKGVTVIDQGNIEKRRGSLSLDDEGNATGATVLIEDGILRNYLQDETNARLMGMAVTGNGRRESYASTVMPRMTNTFMANGSHDPEEILASVDKGIYAVNFGGGQVDITSGKFVFSASEAWWVENGKLQYPVKGATIIGNGPDVMQHISMIGNDMALDSGVGVCGKEGQSVPVGVGQPTLRIDEGLIIGGSQA